MVLSPNSTSVVSAAPRSCVTRLLFGREEPGPANLCLTMACRLMVVYPAIIVISFPLCRVWAILIIAFWLCSGHWKERFALFRNNIFLFLLILYLLFAASGIFYTTATFKEAVREWHGRQTMLVVPVIASLLYQRPERRAQMFAVFNLFVFGALGVHLFLFLLSDVAWQAFLHQRTIYLFKNTIGTGIALVLWAGLWMCRPFSSREIPWIRSRLPSTALEALSAASHLHPWTIVCEVVRRRLPWSTLVFSAIRWGIVLGVIAYLFFLSPSRTAQLALCLALCVLLLAWNFRLGLLHFLLFITVFFPSAYALSPFFYKKFDKGFQNAQMFWNSVRSGDVNSLNTNSDYFRVHDGRLLLYHGLAQNIWEKPIFGYGMGTMEDICRSINVKLYVPAIPQVIATGVAGGVQLNWNTSLGADRYGIWRYNETTWTLLAFVRNTTFTDHTARGGIAETYAVHAFRGGNCSDFDAVTGTALPGEHPDTLQVTATGIVGGVRLDWTAVPNADRYDILRRGQTGWVLLTSVTETTFIDPDARIGIAEIYYIRAFEGKTCSAYKRNVVATALTNDDLETPQVFATGIAGGVKLEWNAVPGADLYEIQRRRGTTWKSLGRVTETAFTDTAARIGERERYTVRAYRNSVCSNVVIVTGTPMVSGVTLHPKGPANPHNEYLCIGIQSGLSGLVLFLLWLGAIFLLSFGKPTPWRNFGLFLVTVLIVDSLFNCSLSYSSASRFYGIFFAALFVADTVKRRNSPRTSFAVILAAAGKSHRFGNDSLKKTFVSLNGRPVWLHSAERFAARNDVCQLIVVVSPEDEQWFRDEYAKDIQRLHIDVVCGGAERFDSVKRALGFVRESIDFVAVHDAARPCVSEESIDAVFEAVKQHDAAILAAPIIGTIKRISGDQIIETVSRENLFEAQTPQVFECRLLLDAYAERYGTPTDDAQLVERLGKSVFIVPGDRRNIKITTQEDFELCRSTPVTL